MSNNVNISQLLDFSALDLPENQDKSLNKSIISSIGKDTPLMPRTQFNSPKKRNVKAILPKTTTPHNKKLKSLPPPMPAPRLSPIPVDLSGLLALDAFALSPSVAQLQKAVPPTPAKNPKKTSLSPNNSNKLSASNIDSIPAFSLNSQKRVPFAPMKKRKKSYSSSSAEVFYPKIPIQAKKIANGDFFDVFMLNRYVFKVPLKRNWHIEFSNNQREKHLLNAYNQQKRLNSQGLSVIPIVNNPIKDKFIKEPFLKEELKITDLTKPSIQAQLATFIAHAVSKQTNKKGETFYELLDLKLDNFRFISPGKLVLCDFWEQQEHTNNFEEAEFHVRNFLRKVLRLVDDKDHSILKNLISKIEDEGIKRRLFSIAIA